MTTVIGIGMELDTVDFGDKRLDKRARFVLETIWADPEASINAACQGWTETIGAYRLFGNDNVDTDKILIAHREATRNRIAEHDVVLVVQDTTELDYTGHPPTGSGPLSYEKQRGFLDHDQLAFTPEGLCLGVLDVNIWARSDEHFGKSEEREDDPIETKESFRWLEGYRLACDLAGQVPDTQIVSVADRECDIYEVFVEAQKRADNAADYVIRLSRNRCLPERDPEAGPCSYRKLFQEMNEAPVITKLELELQRTPKRLARTATVEIRAKRVRLKPPPRKHTKLPEVEVNVVLVREINPPSEDEAIEWVLVTSLPIETAEEVLRVVKYYTGRWPIEIFFRVFKTGCQVERIQLETSERLLPCLMLYKIVAWRVLYLTMLGRECPNLPCDVMFTPDEWMPVWKITSDEPIPEAAPSLSEFLLLLAELGGHNGRLHDGPPGPKSIWIGIRRMTDFTLAWQKFGPGDHTKPSKIKTHDTCWDRRRIRAHFHHLGGAH